MNGYQDVEGVLDAFASILANDPGALAPDSPYFVADLYGPERDNVLHKLRLQVTRKRGQGLYYFMGQRGTGKSTQLKRLAHMLNDGGGCRAFMVDALEFISDNQQIELNDLVLITLVALVDRLQDEFGAGFAADTVVQRLFNWLQSELEIKELNAFGLKVTLKRHQQSVMQRLRAFDMSRREHFVGECRDYAEQLAGRVRELCAVDKVVLIVDSLERLRGTGARPTDVFHRVAQIFDAGAEMLSLPGMQVIYAVPPYLPYLCNIPGTPATHHTLVSIRVCESPTAFTRRRPSGPGLALMRRVVDRRFADWPRVLTPEALDRLMLVSGGDLRQLLRRLLLDAVDAAYAVMHRLPLAADDAVIDRVINKHRTEFEQMVTRDEIPLLAILSQANQVDLRNRDGDLTALARFFDIRAVLNYFDDREWVDVNPLLWNLVAAESARAGADGPR